MNARGRGWVWKDEDSLRELTVCSEHCRRAEVQDVGRLRTEGEDGRHAPRTVEELRNIGRLRRDWLIWLRFFLLFNKRRDLDPFAFAKFEQRLNVIKNTGFFHWIWVL